MVQISVTWDTCHGFVCVELCLLRDKPLSKERTQPAEEEEVRHTENHWQTVSSLEDFMVFLDLKLNPAEERIFVLDLASIYRAAEFRTKVPEHIHIVYIPAQSTSYSQHCDVATFKSWKSVLAHAVSESLAESVVTGQNIKTTFDFSLMHLKRRSVAWAENVTLDAQNRPPEFDMETCQLGIG